MILLFIPLLWTFVDDTRPQRSFIREMFVMLSVSQIKLYFDRRKIECTLIRPGKCKELRISFARNLEEFHVGFVQGKEPEVVSSTKLLGLTTSDNLKWNVDDLIKILYFLLQLKRARLPPVDLALFLYNVCTVCN